MRNSWRPYNRESRHLSSFFSSPTAHATSETLIVCHLQKKVYGKRLFGSFHRKICRSNGTFEKVVLIIRTECSALNWISVPSISSTPSLKPVSGFRGRFFEKWNWFVPMVNKIPGGNLPVLNFAHYLPKPWTDRVNNHDFALWERWKAVRAIYDAEKTADFQLRSTHKPVIIQKDTHGSTEYERYTRL